MNHEASVFSHYLTKRQPPTHAQALYAAKVAEVASETIPPREQRQLSFALSHPWCIGLLDGGLALVNPHAELRRRIYIMFAILEASNQHHQYFLVRRRGPFYVIYVVFVGIRASLKAMCGLVLLQLLRKRS